MKRSEILHSGRFIKLHLKLHLTFIYAFIPRFYSIAFLYKLRSIITSLGISMAQSTIIHIEGNKSLVRVRVPKICQWDERQISWMECYIRKVNTVLNNIISWNCSLRRIIMNIIDEWILYEFYMNIIISWRRVRAGFVARFVARFVAGFVAEFVIAWPG